MESVDGRRVVVLGGYGAVGSVVCRELAPRISGEVVCAGRRLASAQALAAQISGVHPARVDINDSAGIEKLLQAEPVSAVVFAVEPPNIELARVCFEHGVGVVDLSASERLLREIETLYEVASGHGATGVLSVGLAPGLTNLLARHAHDSLGGADTIDITVLLGNGEHHGADAVRWTVRQLIAQNRSHQRSIRVALPNYGRRRAYPFPFSDQYTLRRTLSSSPLVTTRLTFESSAVTTLLFTAQRLRLFRLADSDAGLRLLAALFSRVHHGGDGFAVRVDARQDDRSLSYLAEGNKQSRITGVIAARVAALLHTKGSLDPGVFHLDQLDDFRKLPWQLDPHTLRVSTVSALPGTSTEAD